MTLHSRIVGKGKPLVILHGFLGMGDNWKTLANMFAKENLEVHLLDARNHGRSFRSAELDYTLMAADVIGYCEEHELTNILLMGHSMGGKTAMTLAGKAPDLIEKLIVVDIAPRAYPQHHQQILNGLCSLDFGHLTSRGEVDQALAAYVPDLGTRQFLLKNLYWIEKGKLSLRTHLNGILPNVEQIGKALEAHVVFDKPTLFIKGERSDYITVTDELSIKRQFPQAKIVTIANAGHWVHAENREDFYQVFLEFAT